MARRCTVVEVNVETKNEEEVQMSDVKKIAIDKHLEWKGKIEVIATAPVGTPEELSIAYTPGVAEPCLEIAEDVSKSYDYTRRWNLCAVITNGTAVLGLGDIGPEAGMPVMEGKCALFKAFGDVDAFPLCIRSKDVDEIVKTCQMIAGSFGGINLEDIKAPECFDIERRLKETLDIPVFHDDQHGTAVVTLSGLINALRLVKKDISEVSVLVNGAGAAATAITKLLIANGMDPAKVIMCDSRGALYAGREGMNRYKAEMAEITNKDNKAGTLNELIDGMDVFIGVSAPGVLTGDMVKRMAKDAIVFACANPVPEIMPPEALAAGAAVVATGRSDFPNQINNVLAFPGIFRGTFDVRASDINDEMMVAAAYAIAGLVSEDELNAEYIMPAAFDPRVKDAVAAAVAEAARKSGVATL
jgi:malate dehydrogenase (oxaloacetate-decarboxylating)